MRPDAYFPALQTVADMLARLGAPPQVASEDVGTENPSLSDGMAEVSINGSSTPGNH